MSDRFHLFELSRNLGHSIDTSPNIDPAVKSNAVSAVKRALGAFVEKILAENGRIISNQEGQEIVDRVLNNPPENLQNLFNTLHELMVFQGNSSTYDSILTYLGQLPPPPGI